MGFFGWCCAKCKKPVLADAVATPGYTKYAQGVLLTQNGSKIIGTYDGYGNLDDFEIPWSSGEPKLVHTGCYEGETFEQLPESESDDNQSFFYGDDDLKRLFGPPERPQRKASQ